MNIKKYFLLSILLMIFPASVFAQNEEPETVTETMVVSSPNGASHTYTIKDFSITSAINPAGDEQPNRVVSGNLILVTPPDAGILQWMKLTGSDTAKNVVITITNMNGANGKSELKYTLNAARVASFDAYNSIFSLQFEADNLVINGVNLN